MAINITDDKESLNLTSTEYRMYKDQYDRAFSYYFGTPPTLEEFIRRQRQQPTKLIDLKDDKYVLRQV